MLLIHHQADIHSLYSRYLAEIVRLEGFVDLAEAELATVNEALLAQHDLLLLPRLTPTQAQVELLVNYVRQGGRLIAFLPAANLASQLGLKPTFRGVDSGYLRLEAAAPIVAGLCPEPVQVIGPAVDWTSTEEANAITLARLYPGRDGAGANGLPALVWRRLGQGEAILFAYDLPYTVARLRQGNPAHADLCFAGLDGIYRVSELFVGQLPPEQAYLPQADLQTALLARLIEYLAPRPRLWYYPAAAQRSVMVMTSDDDWSTLEQFETLLAALRRRQAHCTFYIVPGTRLNKTLMDAWEQEGHTFSVHPALESDFKKLQIEEPQRLSVPAMLKENVARHRREFDRVPRTIRQHAIRWLGYVEAAHLLAGLGLKMDFNYFNVYPFCLGYMAGSGRPLPFVDADGSIIPYFQQPSLWTEETLIHPSFVFSLKWTVERALQETRQIIQRGAREFYTPFTLNSHPVSFTTYSSPLVEGVWEGAQAEGMAIISADEWLAWTEARAGARLEQAPGGWILSTPQALPQVTLLLPAPLRPQVEGQVSQQQLWGQMYVALTLSGLAAGEKRSIMVTAA